MSLFSPVALDQEEEVMERTTIGGNGSWVEFLITQIKLQNREILFTLTHFHIHNRTPLIEKEGREEIVLLKYN